MICPKCNTDNGMYAYKCAKCGFELNYAEPQPAEPHIQTALPPVKSGKSKSQSTSAASSPTNVNYSNLNAPLSKNVIMVIAVVTFVIDIMTGFLLWSKLSLIPIFSLILEIFGIINLKNLYKTKGENLIVAAFVFSFLSLIAFIMYMYWV